MIRETETILVTRDLTDTEDQRDINDMGDRDDTGDERLEQYPGDHSILTNYLG